MVNNCQKPNKSRNSWENPMFLIAATDYSANILFSRGNLSA